MNGLGKAFGGGVDVATANAAAVNGLGRAFRVASGNPEAGVTPPPTPQVATLMRLKASEAVALLARDPETWPAIAQGEMARPERARRVSVLEALLAHERAAAMPQSQEALAEALRLLAVSAGEGPE